ncbi:MAG: protein kinase [Archangiaceae bacterium]|nr:protein kinase [Archangiaceae bacterium]
MPTLGRYTIVRKLATGGMAEVYLAKVAGPGGFEKHVVLKSILPQLANDELYVKMFLEEARLAAQLDHPNIVHVFDFGEIDGTYFLTMEYVDGATLRQLGRWSRKPGNSELPPTLATRIVAEACHGLSYAHQFVPPEGSEVSRLVHRDVSPENIMVARNGAVKLLDFGVAKNISEDPRSAMGNGVRGKVSFMPPEQLKGLDLDHRVDIYALGVVLYQVLSGRRPFEGPSDVALIQAVLEAEPVPLLKYRLDLPDVLLDAVMRAISKHPDDRFQTAEAFAEALEQYIASEGQPQGPAQISKLVHAYLADEKTLGPTQQAGSRSTPRKALSAPEARALPPPPPSAPLNRTLSHAAQSTPGTRGPFSASARPPPPDMSETRLEAELLGLGDEPKTDPGRPAFAEAPGRPSAPRPRKASSVALPLSTLGADEPPAEESRRWTRTPVAVEPIRQALREALRADRSSWVLRKLPAVLSRLCDSAAETPWALREVLAGVLDAAVLSDDHSAVASLLERAALRRGRDGRFARLVEDEVQSPLRLAWLVERLRSGLPADVVGLRSWLSRLSASAAPLLLTAIEASDRWPEQEPFAEALAAADPQLTLARLKAGRPQTAAAFAWVLERAGAEGRREVFETLAREGPVSLEVEVLAGRARARGADAVELLEAYLEDPRFELRARALELLGELGGERAFGLLSARVAAPGFEELPVTEAELTWAALLEAGGEHGLQLAAKVLGAKSPLLKKRKDDERKLKVVEALRHRKTESAGALLEQTANDENQSSAVIARARTALESVGATGTEPESRTRLVARVCLELALLARASTTVDVGSGLLDPAIERLREGVRQVQQRDGWLNLEASDTGPTVNGGAVSFGAFHAAAAPRWERALRARDLKGVAIAGPVTAAELRSFLFRAFDPDGKSEPLGNISAFSFAGRALGGMPQIAVGDDATERARELYHAMVGWLEKQRDALRAGASPRLLSADAALDEWVLLMADREVRYLGVALWDAATEQGRLEHAANTAATAMAFAHDLGLPRACLREVCELSLMLGLAAAVERTVDREADPMHAAALLLTHRLNRLGTVVAVAAFEADPSHERLGGGVSVVSSLHALAEAFDLRVGGSGLRPAEALEELNGPLRDRFSPELLGLFTQWAFAQG